MASEQHERKCPLCNTILAQGNLCEYIECSNCGSYVYVSDKTAEDDNRFFYNSVYSCGGQPRYSTIKRKIFNLYEKKDEKNNRKEYSKLGHIRAEIELIFKKGEKSMEVGFGEGRHLLKLLESGHDAYGIDISDKVVSTFSQEYPQYKNRVRVGTRFDEKVHIVYCSALLEHLDDPQEFIDNLSTSLITGGFLIINAIPVVSELKSNIGISEDISFWKPCHRIIPSHKGIEQMFSGKGYVLVNYASIDVFNYKLLSLHIKNGYEDIVQVRHSCIKNSKLPSIHRYFNLCREALNVQSRALVGVYIFRKQ
jgi:SAM-dependent methyltransferase